MPSDGLRADTLCALFAATMASLLLPGTFAVAASPGAPIEVVAAWIRWLPAGLPAAGYATLVNRGDKPLSLISASSPVL